MSKLDQKEWVELIKKMNKLEDEWETLQRLMLKDFVESEDCILEVGLEGWLKEWAKNYQ